MVEINASPAKHDAIGETPFFKESRQRVQSALINSSLCLPRLNITINFAPADIRKVGSGFDLPLAIAMLTVCDLIKCPTL